MLCEFKLGHNVAETIKNIYCLKSEGAVDHRSVTRLFKIFHCKYIDDKARSVRPKGVEAKLMSSTQKVSGELVILQSSGIR